MLVNKMLRYTQIAVPLVASCVLGFCQNANASTLGAASDFNAFVLGNMNQTSDTEGRLAVGGNATLTNYGVGDKLSNSNGTRNDLIVGGTLTYNGGQVFNGNVVYGAGSAPNVSTPHGSIKQGKPIDFTAAGLELKALSGYLASLTPNNNTTVYNWGGVELKGTKSDLNIFNIAGSVFAPGNNVNNFSIDGPMSSTILVNVGGKDISMKNFGFSNNLQAGLRQKVLFNFYEATNIDLQNIGFQGSILAPLANLKTTYGDVNGNVIVASSQGSGEYHNYLFKGTLPNMPTNNTQPKKKVPEPSSLVGLGTIAAGIVVSRRKLGGIK